MRDTLWKRSCKRENVGRSSPSARPGCSHTHPTGPPPEALSRRSQCASTRNGGNKQAKEGASKRRGRYNSYVGRWVHRISQIDPHKRTAFCSNCGWVRINRKGNGHWRCKVAERLYRGKKGRRRNLSGFKFGTCDRCGFVPEHPQQLDIHHRDGNRLNNDPANLQTLCANCHRLQHIYIAETQRKL
jgi:hypothetical protein